MKKQIKKYNLQYNLQYNPQYSYQVSRHLASIRNSNVASNLDLGSEVDEEWLKSVSVGTKPKNQIKIREYQKLEIVEVKSGLIIEIIKNDEDKCEGLILKLKDGLTDFEIIEAVEDILKDLESVGKKGFITPEDLKLDNMPVIKELSKYLVESNAQSVKSLKEGYKWMCNLIYLNLYNSMLKNLAVQGMGSKVEGIEDDHIIDYKNILSLLQSKMDPSIRIKLNKPGLGIVQNIYTGFDTEYKNIDKIYNELISVQLAVNTRTFIKVPKFEDYYTSKIDTLSSRIMPIKKVKGFRYDIFETNVVGCIKDIRSINCQKYDMIMQVLYKGFIELCAKKPSLFSCYDKNGYLVVSLPRTPIEKYVYLNDNSEGFNFSDVLKVSNGLGEKYLKEDYSKVRFVLNNLKNLYDSGLDTDDLFQQSKDELDLTVVNTKPEAQINDMKRYSRSKLRSMDINVNRVKNNYIIAHLTNADLSMLNDFNTLKDSLDIVNKSFITLGKPLKVNDVNVHIRDTMLLAPAGKKGLAAIGGLLGFSKVDLSLEEIVAMDKLLLNNRDKFLNYAITDAVIPLLYANHMEDQLFKSRSLGIPISLSSLSAAYVKDEWDKEGYQGYQIEPEYLIGDSGVTQTPKGLYKTGDVGRKVSLFISSYRGGRNESFMYGVDNDRVWYDYDLTSAYTSAMALLGNPDYSKSRNLTLEELNKYDSNQLINNYIVLRVKFEFPKNLKYPSIPCYLNENTTIYPLEGESTVTGIEYLVAKEQGCVFKEVKDIYMIPFERDSKTGLLINQPFREIIRELQKRRKEYPPKTLGNLMEKEKGNSIYGNIVRGMSNKKKFDIKTGRTLRMEGSVLSNPIIASWTTAFIRATIGECLHNIDALGGSVVSTTTDGFITDICNLEYKLLRGNCKMLVKYREARKLLSIDGLEDALEVKTFGKGIISWTTRGQFSLDGKISASTGFQTKGIVREELECLFKNTMSGEDRIIEFIQSSLRSAKDVYMHGGHVTKVYADRIFRMEFDNKRILNLPTELVGNRDFSNILLDSSPAKNVESVEGLRFLSSFHKSSSYSRMTSCVGKSKYRDNLDLAVRNFVKGCVNDTPGYNLKPFDCYQDLIDFVRAYKPNQKISKSSISNLKNRKLVVKRVPKNPDTLAFVEYVKLKFPNFNDCEFFEG